MKISVICSVFGHSYIRDASEEEEIIAEDLTPIFKEMEDKCFISQKEIQELKNKVEKLKKEVL